MTDAKKQYELPDDIKDRLKGIGDETIKKARDILCSADEETIKDIGSFFIPEGFMTQDQISKFNVEQLKGACVDFLYSDHLYDILIMIMRVLEVEDIQISATFDTDEKTIVKEFNFKNIPQSKKDMTDKELKKLAKEMYEGKLFTDKHLRENEQDLIGSVFMPLLFMDAQSRWMFKKNPPGLIYEYMEKAGPRSINGCPIFFSFRILSQEGTKRMFGFYEQYKKLSEEFEGSEEKHSDPI